MSTLAVHHRKQQLSCGGGGGGEFQKEQTNDSSKTTLCLYESHLRVVYCSSSEYNIPIYFTQLYFSSSTLFTWFAFWLQDFSSSATLGKIHGPRDLTSLPRCLPLLGRMAQKPCCWLFLPRCLRSHARFVLTFTACGFWEAQWFRARSALKPVASGRRDNNRLKFREGLRYT